MYSREETKKTDENIFNDVTYQKRKKTLPQAIQMQGPQSEMQSKVSAGKYSIGFDIDKNLFLMFQVR